MKLFGPQSFVAASSGDWRLSEGAAHVPTGSAELASARPLRRAISCWRWAAQVALIVFGLSLGAADQARAETIARASGFSPVATFGDDAAWLQNNEVRAFVNGHVRTIARSPERRYGQPAYYRSVDLGPDSDGSTVAVFDYCRARRVSGRRARVEDCDVFKHSFESGRTVALDRINTASSLETFPTIWRGQIIIARESLRTGTSRVVLIDRDGSRRRLTDGSVGDLRGTRRVFRRTTERDTCGDQEPAKVGPSNGVAVPSIQIENVITRQRTTLDTSACETGQTSDVRYAQFTPTGPVWQADVATECGGINAPRCNYPTAPHIRQFINGQVQEIAIGDNRVFSFGISDSALYWFSLDTPTGERTPEGSSLNRIPRPQPGDPPRSIGPPE